MKHSKAYEYHHGLKFYARKDKYERRIKSCGGILGVLHKFKNQNLTTFEDSSKYRDNVTFAAYCDCETGTIHKCMLDPENRELFPVLT